MENNVMISQFREKGVTDSQITESYVGSYDLKWNFITSSQVK